MVTLVDRVDTKDHANKPEDLLRHNCLNITYAPSLRRWPFAAPEGVRHVEVTGNVSANTAE